MSSALSGGQPADAPQERGEVLAVHELHREEEVALRLAHVVDAADRRVRHLARHAHLAVEAREPLARRASRPWGRNFRATGCSSFRSSAR